ncbi:DUF6466 family protein [Bifidobacterium sp.]|jgi:hypothetical protein|uniref:DUF6466 family protein n=1 Tax=Bifidobacterium sp. TaxID=41200 RepID=UPI0025B9C0BC|nr:DUF6466 family protein [Bifidobacterium sp.]MCH4208672.1 DUF6466 family protein [Bifidobacterium sp.]MCI1224356.1 DUF6466 family protein [Bifidobacterium sp.]
MTVNQDIARSGARHGGAGRSGVKRYGGPRHNGQLSEHALGNPAPALAIPPAGTSTAGSTGSPSPRRSPLAVRLLLVASAIALGAAMVFCALNLHAIGVYNQATQSLNANLKAAASPEVDLGTLKTRQQQTDAQFGDVQAFTPILLPAVKAPVQANARISQTLTARINQELAKQSKQDASSGGASPDTPGKATPSPTQSSGLSHEQRSKVEDLLKANQQRSSDATSKNPSASPTSDGDDGNTADGAKPW